MNNNYYCIIMAGGMGKRFWPYSRKALPKQFLDFLGTGQTLLEQTFDRYKYIVPPENIFISTHSDYKDIVLQQIPETDESHLIVENERRNTAPAIAYATHIIQEINPDATIVITPCDQLILKYEEFKHDILKGLEFASRNDKLITLGIKPNRPETGYGYIQIDDEKEGDFHKVKTFIEKPALEFAEIFVQSNEFYWNSGIFIWNVQAIQKAFHTLMPTYVPVSNVTILTSLPVRISPSTTALWKRRITYMWKSVISDGRTWEHGKRSMRLPRKTKTGT